VKWPADSSVGAPQNDGVANTVQQTKGAIGYVELIFAMSNNIPFGAMQNKAGKFVSASMDSVSAAAGALKDIRMIFASRSRMLRAIVRTPFRG